jgi:hypothetical protein
LTTTNCRLVTHALRNGSPCHLGSATKAPVSSGTCTVLAFRKLSTDASTGFCTRQTSVLTFIQTKAVASGWSTPTRLPRHCLMNVPVSLSNLEMRPTSALLVKQSACISTTPTSHFCFRLACHVRTVVDPGDAIYFPDRFWHATINLDPFTAFVSTFTTEHNLLLNDEL